MQEKEGGDGVKQILVILGGGRRNGNTKQLADSFVSGAAQAGHQVETIALSEIEVKGCLGCNACRYGKPCVQPDDFNRIVPKLKEADLVAPQIRSPKVRCIR